MELDPRNILLWIISIANVALGLLIVLKDRKNIVNRFFGDFAISIALWSFVLIAFRTFQQESIARITIKVSYIAAVFIAASFWDFAVAFTTQRPLLLRKRVFLWGAVFGMAILLLLPSFLTREIVYHSWGKSVRLGVFEYLLFFSYFMFFFFGGLVIVGKKLRTAIGTQKLQLAYIFWSVLIAGTGGVIFNLFLPSPFLNEWRLIWLGPIFTFLIVLFITYAIAKHQLLNVKAIAAELLTIALVVGLAIEMFFSKNIVEALFRLVILGFVATSGVLLVRSVINEVKRREEMERLKNELEIAYVKLKEVDQAKTDFLSMASHQLRSPLTVVRLGLAAMLDGTFGEVKDPRQIDAMKKMADSATRLINLIGEYLNVSRIELGKMKYNFKEQDVCMLLKELVDEYQPRAEQKKLKLIFERVGEIPKIKFDEEKLRHVIVNVIDNAIKYTNTGSIAVKCEKTATDIKVAFKDTGMGLEKEDIEVLFQKFRRASSANIRRREGEPIEGSGLGLHVAKMFVDKHGGKIWAESAGHGKGSTFVFTLPLAGPPPLDPEEMGEGGKGVELPRY